VSFKVLGFEL